MSTALLVAGLLVLILVALLDAVFLAEIAAGLVSGCPSAGGKAAAPAIAVIVPAHDEALALAGHLAALKAIIPEAARILLVADNCTDATAEIARAAGVEVIERHDPARRGKGYALAHGRDHLASAPPQVAIVLDADCLPERGALERLAVCAMATGHVVQGAYLFRPAPFATPAVQVSNFAIAVKNLIRQRGARRLGAAAILTGSGMAFPWPIFAKLDLATGEVVEDLALGIDLVRRDAPPLFEERATIWSDSSSDSGTRTQRARWEGGFLAIARRHALPLVIDGVRRGSWPAFWLGLHLLTPPLALLLVLNLMAMGLLGGLALAGMPAGIALVAAGLVALVVSAVFAAWLTVGHAHLPASRLVRLPAYLLWKIALHLRLVSGRQRVAWTRTERIDQDR